MSLSKFGIDCSSSHPQTHNPSVISEAGRSQPRKSVPPALEMGLLFNPDQPGRKKNNKNEKRWGFASPNSISGGIWCVSDQTQPRRDCSGCAAGAASPGSATGMAPRGPQGSASSKACSLFPLQKSLPSVSFWSSARQTGGIFWERSCSPATFLLLASCCCFALLISPFSLSLHVSPLEVRSGSLLPPPCAHPDAKIQETRGSADHPPRGFENHKSSGMPEARRPNIQCTQQHLPNPFTQPQNLLA